MADAESEILLSQLATCREKRGKRFWLMASNRCALVKHRYERHCSENRRKCTLKFAICILWITVKWITVIFLKLSVLKRLRLSILILLCSSFFHANDINDNNSNFFTSSVRAQYAFTRHTRLPRRKIPIILREFSSTGVHSPRALFSVSEYSLFNGEHGVFFDRVPRVKEK